MTRLTTHVKSANTVASDIIDLFKTQIWRILLERVHFEYVHLSGFLDKRRSITLKQIVCNAIRITNSS